MTYSLLFELVKKNWKLAAFIVVSLVAVYFYLHARSERERADEAEKGRSAAIALSNSWQQMTTRYKNSYGDEVLKVQALEVDKTNIEALSKSKELEWLKKFEGLKKNAGNLRDAATFQSNLNTSEIVTRTVYVPCKDSLKASDYEFVDQWNTIKAKVIGTPTIEIKDRYYVVFELQRPKGWFWKFQWSKKNVVGEITNSNKLIKIDSAAVFSVR